jgi:hypothetical protein
LHESRENPREREERKERGREREMKNEAKARISDVASQAHRKE